MLAVIALLFVTELIPLAVTAMGGAIACGLLGFIPAKQVFSGLSNSTVVLFAGMFVVGASMFYTGLAQKIGASIVKISGTGENSLMFGIMLVGAALSAVLSNTGTAACLLPVVLGICSAAKIPASRQLMPLAFACGLGGIITMVGTPPNIIANGALQAAGMKEQFGFFEYAWIGIPVTLAGMLYMMFLGKYLLPNKQIDADQEIEQEVEANETSASKQIVSAVILLCVVLTMAIGIPGVSLEMAAIIGAIQSEVNEELVRRLNAGEVPHVRQAFLANAQSKVLLVEFDQEIAEKILDAAPKFGAAPHPVGSESKYEFAPMIYRVSGTFRAQDPTIEHRMIRINPMRSGPDTIIRILRSCMEQVEEN